MFGEDGIEGGGAEWGCWVQKAHRCPFASYRGGLHSVTWLLVHGVSIDGVSAFSFTPRRIIDSTGSEKVKKAVADFTEQRIVAERLVLIWLAPVFVYPTPFIHTHSHACTHTHAERVYEGIGQIMAVVHFLVRESAPAFVG